jgi:hypothetical protein
MSCDFGFAWAMFFCRIDSDGKGEEPTRQNGAQHQSVGVIVGLGEYST